MNNNSCRDWLIIIISSAIVLIIFILLSWNVFNHVNDSGYSDITNQNELSAKLLDQKTLQGVVDNFSMKKLNFDELRKNPLRFEDPSI
ncbi:MAG: hypothetical protein NUV47_01780 [Patescibacteria group bacterium]|nr:hypothetical protein [Patescibacteria group bacterium]